MKTDFEKAFENLTDCLVNVGKGVESFFDDLITEKETDNTSKIKIKKGSKVFIGKNTFVKLLADVDAEVCDEPPADKKE